MCASHGCAAAGREAALGNITESAHAESGAMSTESVALRKSTVDSHGKRTLLKKGHYLRKKAGRLLSEKDKMSRVASCCERRAKGLGGKPVEKITIRGTDDGRAWMSGVWRCANAWACPVCAATMSTSRRLDIECAVAQHKEADGTFALLTLTFPHTRDMRLKETLSSFQNAKRFLTQRAAWKRLKESVVGTITTLEITHGDNGWHPHQHILLFVKSGVMIDDSALYDSWASCCEKAGLSRPSEEHGLDLRFSEDGSSYAAYVEKEGNSWKLSNELTSVNKLGHKNSKTGFQLLEDYCEGDLRSGVLFKEFVEGVAGRAKHAWSPGLKAYFGIDDKSEDEEADPDSFDNRDVRDVAHLTPAGFSLVTRYSAVGTVLTHAHDRSYLSSLLLRLSKLDGSGSRFLAQDLIQFE